MEDEREERITVKLRGADVDLENLKDEDIAKMTHEEVKDALVKILENTDKGTQRKLIRAIKRYRNISGLDLEEELEKELEL